MADLLGSILGSMEKPPSINSVEKKKAKGATPQFNTIILKKNKTKMIIIRADNRLCDFIIKWAGH